MSGTHAETNHCRRTERAIGRPGGGADVQGHRRLCSPVRWLGTLWTTGPVSGQRCDGGSFSNSAVVDARRRDRARSAK